MSTTTSQTGRRARVRSIRRQKRRVAYSLLLPALLILLGLAIFPLLYAGWISFRFEPLYDPTIARFVGWRNYSDLTEDVRFWESIRLTVLWAIVVVSIQMVLGFILAVLLDRHLRDAGLIRSLIIIPVFISPVAMGLTWRFIFEPVHGLANWILDSGLGLGKATWLSSQETALSTLMIVDCWQWTPFVALILLAGIQSISPEVVEAARLDRVRGLAYQLRIVIPLIRPVILVVLLLRLVDSIRIFDIAYLMTKGGPGTSTLLASVYSYFIFEQLLTGLMAAYGFLILILVNIVVAIFLNTLYRQEKATREADSA